MTRKKQQSFNEWLVIRAQQGDRDSANNLLKHWQPRYYLYALKRLQNREAALDVTQDCLLSINRGLGRLSDPGAYPAWSFRILERRCTDWLRKAIREREFVTAADKISDVADTNNEDRDDAKTTVTRVLQTMDARLATVLRLYYLEELPVADIAAVMDVPHGTIKSRLFYARKLFINAMNDDKGDYNE